MHILASTERLMEVIREELEAVREIYGDARRTEITAAVHDIDMEELIAQEDVVVTLSNAGYVKYQILSDYVFTSNQLFHVDVMASCCDFSTACISKSVTNCF